MDTKNPLSQNEGMEVKKDTAPASSIAVKTAERSDAEVGKVRVIESDMTSPLPGVRSPMVKLDMTKVTDCALNFDKDTVVYLIYLLYKTNMIARNNLRNMIDEINKPMPNDPLKWLVNEAAKAGR